MKLKISNNWKTSLFGNLIDRCEVNGKIIYLQIVDLLFLDFRDWYQVYQDNRWSNTWYLKWELEHWQTTYKNTEKSWEYPVRRVSKWKTVFNVSHLKMTWRKIRRCTVGVAIGILIGLMF